MTAVEDLKPLTSLRFFAAAMIVVLHMDSFLKVAPFGHIRVPLSVGVSFFFVLSGFILTHVYTARPTSFVPFMRKRIGKLWPNTVLALALMFFLIPGWEASQFPKETGLYDPALTALAQALMVQSFVLDARYFMGWNTPAWSISTEFGFYLAFPVLLIAIRRTWHWKLACAAILLVLLILVVPRDLYAFPPARLVEFSAGMAAWVLWDRHIRHAKLPMAAWSALEAAAFASVILWLVFCPLTVPIVSPHYSIVLRHPFWALPIPLLLIAVASGRGVIGRWLSRTELVYLGQISFAIYIFHFPIINLMGYYTWKWGIVLSPAQTTSVFLALTFAISAVAYRYWEVPMQRIISVRPLPKVQSAQPSTIQP